MEEQTPITAEEFYLKNRGDLLRSNLGTKEFTIDMMEQYAQAKVLEALEREFEGVSIYLGIEERTTGKEYYETEVKPNYE
jgi:hypothetical protein